MQSASRAPCSASTRDSRGKGPRSAGESNSAAICSSAASTSGSCAVALVKKWEELVRLGVSEPGTQPGGGGAAAAGPGRHRVCGDAAAAAMHACMRERTWPHGASHACDGWRTRRDPAAHKLVPRQLHQPLAQCCIEEAINHQQPGRRGQLHRRQRAQPSSTASADGARHSAAIGRALLLLLLRGAADHLCCCQLQAGHADTHTHVVAITCCCAAWKHAVTRLLVTALLACVCAKRALLDGGHGTDTDADGDHCMHACSSRPAGHTADEARSARMPACARAC